MQVHIPPSDATRPDDPTRTADHGYYHRERKTRVSEISDGQIIGALRDLFAGRTRLAFGEKLDWWVETLQCDLAPRDAAGVVLTVISQHPDHRRIGARGVQALRAELVKRARMLIERSMRDTGEVVL
ncbi:hypothetical protein AVE30378_02529 [Achromobacter veterisilvae]|uniref:Uncharacterized protein n=1 Tax=Achromobacter veterisilvae TaxID=2069367 RepID=A0A446CH72_9BURK|nr:hypothetical protein [Achromobacter veterisilvae]SSW67256.1 hypothetical protein AVE30378_02529 [Achromobacter veterisilvae]